MGLLYQKRLSTIKSESNLNSSTSSVQQIGDEQDDLIGDVNSNNSLKVCRSVDKESGMSRLELRFVCYVTELPINTEDEKIIELRAVQMTMAALFSALETHQSQLKPEEEKALVKTVISSLFEEADSRQVDTDDRLVNFLGDEEDIEYKGKTVVNPSVEECSDIGIIRLAQNILKSRRHQQHEKQNYRPISLVKKVQVKASKIQMAQKKAPKMGNPFLTSSDVEVDSITPSTTSYYMTTSSSDCRPWRY